MKYVRYALVALGLLTILAWAGNWVFAKEHINSPFAYPFMARSIIIWGALVGALLAGTWKSRIVFIGLGGLAAWLVLHAAYSYHLHNFPA
jgi:hypothetical protein